MNKYVHLLLPLFVDLRSFTLGRRQPVPHAPYRLQPLWGLGVFVQLPPEISDMDLNGPLIGLADVSIVAIVLAPDYTNQVSLRADSSSYAQ